MHACVCALVVLVAHRCGVGSGTAAGKRWQPAALCGLLFAVHPVHVEAYFHTRSAVIGDVWVYFVQVGCGCRVANVAGRAEVLSAVLSLGAFLCFTGAW